MPDGLRFGSLDPTLTVLTLQNADNTNVATVYSAPCHPVSIYPFHRGVSADWPGPANERISEVLGGETFFLQGCAGDIVPASRGEEARTEMARFFAERAIAAARSSHRLPSSPLKVATGVVGLPLVSEKRKEAGADIRPVELQVVVCGPFGLAVLPGEPLNGLAREIQARSPLPHTLVIGYANGRGVSYVGLPGEKARGGYEARAGQGTEEAGESRQSQRRIRSRRARDLPPIPLPEGRGELSSLDHKSVNESRHIGRIRTRAPARVPKKPATL